MLGNEVATLIDEFNPAGNYEIEFNARDLSAVIYLYRIQTSSFVQTKKWFIESDLVSFIM